MTSHTSSHNYILASSHLSTQCPGASLGIKSVSLMKPAIAARATVSHVRIKCRLRFFENRRASQMFSPQISEHDIRKFRLKLAVLPCGIFLVQIRPHVCRSVRVTSAMAWCSPCKSASFVGNGHMSTSQTCKHDMRKSLRSKFLTSHLISIKVFRICFFWTIRKFRTKLADVPAQNQAEMPKAPFSSLDALDSGPFSETRPSFALQEYRNKPLPLIWGDILALLLNASCLPHCLGWPDGCAAHRKIGHVTFSTV